MERLIVMMLASLSILYGVRGTTVIVTPSSALAAKMTQVPTASPALNSTRSVIPTQQQIKPSTAGGIHGGMSTAAPGQGSDTRVTIKFTACDTAWNETLTNKSAEETKKLVEDTVFMIRNKTFQGGDYDIKKIDVSYVENDKGKVNVTVAVSFGPGLKAGILPEQRFQEFAKQASDYCIQAVEVTFQGVILGQWKIKAGECKNKCCSGAGGPIILQRSCTEQQGGAPNTCARVLREMKVAVCTGYCSEPDCSSAETFSKAPILLILAAVILFIA